MPSLIDPSQPVSGNPTTQSVRDNFLRAKQEVEQLQTLGAQHTAQISAIQALPQAFKPQSVGVALQSAITFAANVDQQILWDSLEYAADGAWDATGKLYLCTETGDYLVSVALMPRATTGTGSLTASLLRSGLVTELIGQISITTTGAFPMRAQTIVRAAKNATLGVRIRSSVAGAFAQGGTEPWNARNNFRVTRIG